MTRDWPEILEIQASKFQPETVSVKLQTWKFQVGTELSKEAEDTASLEWIAARRALFENDKNYLENFLNKKKVESNKTLSNGKRVKIDETNLKSQLHPSRSNAAVQLALERYAHHYRPV